MPRPVSDWATVAGLQERAARAFPAAVEGEAGGWGLRHTPHCAAWWLSAVLPHTDARGGELVGRVEAAERFYARHQAVARFQVTPPACPDELDDVLGRRGYEHWGEVALEVAATADVTAAPHSAAGGAAPHSAAGGAAVPVTVRLEARPTAAWFDLWQTVHRPGEDTRAEWAMLQRLGLPSAYAIASAGDEVVAVGRAVADTGWVGIFGMATLPPARGKGAARAVLGALGAWADALGVARLYLQVLTDNHGARHLYRQMGFEEVCTYHYRSAV